MVRRRRLTRAAVMVQVQFVRGLKDVAAIPVIRLVVDSVGLDELATGVLLLLGLDHLVVDVVPLALLVYLRLHFLHLLLNRQCVFLR